MDPNLLAVIPESEQSASIVEPQIPLIPLERQIGRLVGLTASALAAAGLDYVNSGRLSVAPKLRAAKLIVQLFELRQMMIPHWDFDAICHQHGRQWLLEKCGPDVNPSEQERIIDEFVNGTMEILHKVALSELH